MAKFIKFLYKFVYLYLYFVIGACVLAWVPNINPDYPMFHYIFKLAGFYLVKPIFGLNVSVAIIMVGCAIIVWGLEKIYDKYFKKADEPKIIIMTQDEFMKKFGNQQQENNEGNKDDSN